MAYAFINKTQATGLSATATGNKPTGTVDGNLVIAVLAYADGKTITPPTGFTSRARAVSAGVGVIELFSHIAASDGASYSFTLSTSGSWIIEVLSYSGMNQSSLFDVSSTNSAGSGTTITGSAVTAAAANEMLFFVGAAFVPGTTYSGLSASLTSRETSNMQCADQQISASGTTGTRQVTGSGSSPWVTVMALFKVAAVPLTVGGSLTSSGAFTKQDSKTVSGALTSSGLLTKQVQKVLSGALTSSGTLSNIKTVLLTIAGTLTSSGILLKQIRKVFSGAITPSGALIKSVSKLFAGALTSSGLLIKRDNKTLGGSLSSSGLLQKQAQKIVTGNLTLSGVLANIKTAVLNLAGNLSPTGALSKQVQKGVGGALTPAGSTAKNVQKFLAGILISIGQLIPVKTGPTVLTAGFDIADPQSFPVQFTYTFPGMIYDNRNLALYYSQETFETIYASARQTTIYGEAP